MPAPPTQLQELFVPTPAALRHIIQHFVLLTVGEGARPVVQTLLPTFQVLLLINLGAEAQMWPAGSPSVEQAHPVRGIVLTGPVKTALHYRLPPGGRVLAAAFTLEGFFRLFRLPVGVLGSGFIAPDDLVKNWGFAQLWEQLVPLHGPSQLVQAVADFLVPHLHAAEAPQAQLIGQLPLLSGSTHLNPVKVMAAASQLSERALQLRFRKYLGFSAKEAVRFIRFRQVLDKLQQSELVGRRTDWLALLAQHGYYDQSHLIHDFTYFLQQPPSAIINRLLLSDAICFTSSDLFASSNSQ
jgi:AraC-like DNA-binding protein